jgi:hypothetical protein
MMSTGCTSLLEQVCKLGIFSGYIIDFVVLRGLILPSDLLVLWFAERVDFALIILKLKSLQNKSCVSCV